MKGTRLAVVIFSILAAIISVVEFVILKAAHQPVPLWNDLLMAYGLVFVVFLFFDRIGREAAMLRAEKDMPSSRPKPVPGQAPGQRVAAIPARANHTHVRLERVKLSQKTTFTKMCDLAMMELYALEERKPSLDAAGHVADVPIDEWLTNPNFYAFFILYHGAPVGFSVLEKSKSELYFKIHMFYVETAARRRFVGSIACEKIREFAELLGETVELGVNVSASNMRGQRFFESVGFRCDIQEGNGSSRLLKREV